MPFGKGDGLSVQEISISNYFLRAVLRYAERQGLNVQRLLHRARITPRLLLEPSARVTAEQFASLQAITMREMNDEMLGYSTRPLKIGTGSALCHWMIQSRTLGQALKRYGTFYSLMERGLNVTLSTADQRLEIRFSPWQQGESPDPYAYELFLFCFHRFACWLIEDDLSFEQVCFPYAQPPHAQEYRLLFPRAQCSFDQPHCTVVLDSQWLNRPIRQTPETLVQFLRHPLRSILINDYNQQSWAARTRAILRRQLETTPTLVEIAEQLNIHPKKLRRLLEAEGIAYSELKNQLRRDVAIRQLTRGSASIEQISALLGFSETCTFIRAFKCWTGVTPYTYRKRARGSVS